MACLRQPLAEPPGDYFDPDILAVNNHYPFGMLQPGRYWERGWYDSLGHRYGFNGMERDDDIMESRTSVSNARTGAGNSYTTQFRQFDPRTGRWWSRDPIVKAWESPPSLREISVQQVPEPEFQVFPRGME